MISSNSNTTVFDLNANRRPVWRYIFMSALAVIAVCLSFSVGLILGLVGGNTQAYHLRYLEEQRLISPILNGDRAFAKLELMERSNGGVYLIGSVDSPTDADRLRQSITLAVGQSRCNEILLAVSVRK